MKIITIIGMLFVNFCTAQYVSMIDSSLKWYQSFTIHPMGGTVHQEFQYYFRNISENNGARTGDLYQLGWPPEVFICTVREDSLHRVYYQNYSTGVDFLLYDYDANEGDTIFFSAALSQPDTSFYVIDSIKEISNSGYTYQAQFVQSNLSSPWLQNYTTTWLQGIGAIDAVLSRENPNFGSYERMCSVYKNDTLIFYQNSECRNLLNVKESEPELFFYQENRMVHITSLEPILTEVFDLNGRKAGVFSGADFYINEKYVSGFYLLKMSSKINSRSFTIRKIIID